MRRKRKDYMKAGMIKRSTVPDEEVTDLELARKEKLAEPGLDIDVYGFVVGEFPGGKRDHCFVQGVKTDMKRYYIEDPKDENGKPIVGSKKLTRHMKLPKGLKKGLVPDKGLQALHTYSDYDQSVYRKDKDDVRKKAAPISVFWDNHPYHLKGQRSIFYNNSSQMANLINPGAQENFPNPDVSVGAYPGFPFEGEEDQREWATSRQVVGTEAFASWDKPLVSKPQG